MKWSPIGVTSLCWFTRKKFHPPMKLWKHSLYTIHWNNSPPSNNILWPNCSFFLSSHLSNFPSLWQNLILKMMLQLFWVTSWTLILFFLKKKKFSSLKLLYIRNVQTQLWTFWITELERELSRKISNTMSLRCD